MDDQLCSAIDYDGAACAGFGMITQILQFKSVFAVPYMVGGHLLVAGILLFIVGVSKYAERTVALRCSSFSQIVTSADPMNTYIGKEGVECNYLVSGLKRWRKNTRDKVTINDVWESEGREATKKYLFFCD
ncbi:hypothetical protein KI387_025858 [Taxus chinensis]|uniref:DUF4220 domain-containing protein n=1 Tax=Taxus chinensis TaxID=29808 RepID=A0AA38FVG9_TAXCH|nr:hypothetical protein KI387_025858 [Taxus chinensis]